MRLGQTIPLPKGDADHGYRAGHVSKQLLKRHSHIRMEAKRKALESIVAKKMDTKPDAMIPNKVRGALLVFLLVAAFRRLNYRLREMPFHPSFTEN